jgi:hypothetical protein
VNFRELNKAAQTQKSYIMNRQFHQVLVHTLLHTNTKSTPKGAISKKSQKLQTGYAASACSTPVCSFHDDHMLLLCWFGDNAKANAEFVSLLVCQSYTEKHH